MDSILILPENYEEKLNSDIKEVLPKVKRIQKRLSLSDLRTKRYHMRRNLPEGSLYFKKKPIRQSSYSYVQDKLIPPKILRVPDHYKGRSLMETQDKLTKR